MEKNRHKLYVSNKTIILLLGAMIIAAFVSLSSAGDSNNPSEAQRFPMPFGATLTYRIIEMGKDKKTTQISRIVLSEHSFSEAASVNGVKVVRHTCRETRSDGVVQNWAFTYSFNTPIFKALRYSLQKASPKGDVYYKEEYEFGDPFFKIPGDVVHTISAPFLLAGMNFASRPKLSLHTWNADGEPASIGVTVVGEERVAVPYKTADAWKVFVKTDVEKIIKNAGMAGRLTAAMIPDFYIWFDKTAPHLPLKITWVFGRLALDKREYVQQLERVSKN